MQALKAARDHSHHHSEIYSYWSYCVNAKDYEEPELEQEEEEDLFASLENEISSQLQALAKINSADGMQEKTPDLSTQSSCSNSSQQSISGSGPIIIGGGDKCGDDKRCWNQDQLLQPLQPFRPRDAAATLIREYSLDVDVVADVVDFQ